MRTRRSTRRIQRRHSEWKHRQAGVLRSPFEICFGGAGCRHGGQHRGNLCCGYGYVSCRSRVCDCACSVGKEVVGCRQAYLRAAAEPRRSCQSRLLRASRGIAVGARGERSSDARRTWVAGGAGPKRRIRNLYVWCVRMAISGGKWQRSGRRQRARSERWSSGIRRSRKLRRVRTQLRRPRQKVCWHGTHRRTRQ